MDILCDMLLIYFCLIIITFKTINAINLPMSKESKSNCDNFINQNLMPYQIPCTNSSVKLKDCMRNDLKCSNWCENNLKWQVVNNKLGIVKFSIPFPPETCCYESYRVTLKTGEGNCDFKNSSVLSHVHSSFEIATGICSKNCTNCKQEIEFEVKFLFTSCYALQIKPHPDETCTTDAFLIETDYKKKLIANSSMKISHRYEENSELLFTAISFGISFPFGAYPDSALVKLNSGIDATLEDCSGTGNRESCCSTGEDQGYCCTHLYKKEKECACHWVGSVLNCQFNNISFGNYCLQIDLVDPRCDFGALWTRDNGCNWFYPFFFNSTAELKQEEAIATNGFPNWIIVILIVIVCTVLAVIAIVYFKTYPKIIYRQYISFSPSNKQVVSIITAPKMLLLYPRDCESFMNAMAEFRLLLQDILHAQVFDIWDNDNWNLLAEHGLHLVLGYLTDVNVKIIVVASPCAILIEDILRENRSFEYNMPHCHDDIYYFSFKKVIELSHSATDKYNRIFVVRLDGKDCSDIKFTYLSACTIYTLPQHLKDFVMDVYNMDTTEIVLNPDKLARIHHLSYAIKDFDKYKEHHGNYLENLIDIS